MIRYGCEGMCLNELSAPVRFFPFFLTYVLIMYVLMLWRDAITLSLNTNKSSSSTHARAYRVYVCICMCICVCIHICIRMHTYAYICSRHTHAGLAHIYPLFIRMHTYAQYVCIVQHAWCAYVCTEVRDVQVHTVHSCAFMCIRTHKT